MTVDAPNGGGSVRAAGAPRLGQQTAWAVAGLGCAVIAGVSLTASYRISQDVWHLAWLVLTAATASAVWTRHRRDPGWQRLALALVAHTAAVVVGLGPLSLLVIVPLFLSSLSRLGSPGRWTIPVVIDAMIASVAVVGTVWVTQVDLADAARADAGPVPVVLTWVLCAIALAGTASWALRHDAIGGATGLLAIAGGTGAMVPIAFWLGPPAPGLAQSPTAAPVLTIAMVCILVAASIPGRRAPRRLVRSQLLGRLRIAMVAAGAAAPAMLQVDCAVQGQAGCDVALPAIQVSMLALLGVRAVTAARDSERDRRTVRSRERRFKALVQNASDGLTLMRADGTVLMANPAVERMAGGPVIGRQGISTVVPECREDMLATFAEAAEHPGTVALTHARTVGRPDREVEVRIIDHRSDPDIGAFVAYVRDVTAERQHQSAVERLAYRDSLTGLLNRAAFTARLDELLDEGAPIAVLFCDLDRLKLVNDVHGHMAGDRMIVTVGERLQALLGDDALVARIGGDEYLIALHGDLADTAVETAERVRLAMRRPIDIGGGTVRASCSIGVAHVRGPGTAEQLIIDADAALYRAKTTGRDRVAAFDTTLRLHRDSRRLIQSQLPQALATSQLGVEYQPILSARTGRVEAVEALVRWEHPELGRLLPDVFLELAEEAGLIGAIGWHVLDTAVAEAARCPTIPRFSVNVAPAQLSQPGFANRVMGVLATMGVEPDRLQLEVTESSFIPGVHSAVRELTVLRSAGVRIALDDFGTGYASFAALESLPLDILKIDRSLLQLRAGDGAVLRAVVSMAAALGLRVVVEGVEDDDEQETATALGADLLQGFHLASPGPIQRVLREMADARRATP